MDFPVAFPTERDEIFFSVWAELAPRLKSGGSMRTAMAR
jgi:hypothetical protein